ncbi:MAG: hypothetical protein HC774_01560 [Sphingomonadales bacterium]|nr:hypothetical protein [Sphingomonadales bacterium]
MRGVDAQHDARLFQPQEDVVDALSVRKGFHLRRLAFEDIVENSMPGWVRRRLSSHESRGSPSQWTLSGAAPLASSQTPTSIAVLPAPRMQKRVGRGALPCHRWGSALGVTRRTPSSMANLGVCVDGTVVP